MLTTEDIAKLKTETKKYIANFTTEVTDDQANGLDRIEDQRKINFVRLLLEILEGFHANSNLTVDEQDLLWQRITCLSKIRVADL